MTARNLIPFNKIHMADAKISVSGLKKTIYIFCIIFFYFLSYHENTQKTVDFKQVDTSPQGSPVRHRESLLGAGMVK